MVADEAGDENRDDGEQGDQHEEGREASGWQADSVNNLLGQDATLQ